MGDTFEVDTDHKPLVPLLSGYRTTASLRLGRIASAYKASTIASITYPERREQRTMKQTTIHSIHSHWLRKRARPVKTKLNLS